MYFQESRRFRAQLLHETKGRTNLSPKHVEAYRTMALPRFVYVCDLVVPCWGVGGRPFRCRGEIVLDATSPPYDLADSVLAMRIGDTLYVRDKDTPIVDKGYHAKKGDAYAPLNLEEYFRGP